MCTESGTLGSPTDTINSYDTSEKKSQEAKNEMLSEQIFYLKKQHIESDVDGRWTIFMRFRNIFFR
eukprot:UN27591